MATFISESESFYPVEVKSTVEVEGITTEISTCFFKDYIFVIITQINKFGTIMKASVQNKSDGGVIYNVSTLLGKRDDPLLMIYARQLIERSFFHTNKPLILSISLQDEGRGKEHFEAILTRVMENILTGN
jgi:proteasome assembly chaperone 3